jgi:hypothetical protein
MLEDLTLYSTCAVIFCLNDLFSIEGDLRFVSAAIQIKITRILIEKTNKTTAARVLYKVIYLFHATQQRGDGVYIL